MIIIIIPCPSDSEYYKTKREEIVSLIKQSGSDKEYKIVGVEGFDALPTKFRLPNEKAEFVIGPLEKVIVNHFSLSEEIIKFNHVPIEHLQLIEKMGDIPELLPVHTPSGKGLKSFQKDQQMFQQRNQKILKK